MNGCVHGSKSACTFSGVVVVVVVVRREDDGRLPCPGGPRLRTGSRDVSWQRDDLAAVGRLQHLARERPLGWAEGDLAAVQAQDAVEAARLLEVVRGDEEAAALGRE